MENVSCTFYPPEARAWAYTIGCHGALLFGAGVPIALWAYYWGRRHHRSCLILAILVAGCIPLYLHHGRINNQTTTTSNSMVWVGYFLASTFGFSTAFKLWNVAYQQYPEGADASLRIFVFWFLLLPEPQLIKGKTRTLSTTEIKGIILALIPKLLALSVVLSILTTKNLDLEYKDHKSLLHRVIAHFLPTKGETLLQEEWNGFIHLWWLYLFVSSLLELSVIASLPLTGFQAMEDAFQNPLLESRSLAEFWGSRWNLPVHRLLQRTCYIPMRKQGYPRPLAVLGTFLVSGLLHEYNFWTHNHAAYQKFGVATLFFLFMGLFMLLEHWISTTMLAPNDSKMHANKNGIPSVAIALGYTLLSAIPVERFFIKSWLEAGMIQAVAPLFPHMTCG